MDITELGFRIKQCRKSKQLTQEKLAELIDVSSHYIYEIEKGLKCMSLPTLVDIALALNTSTDYLLFGTQEYSSEKQINQLDVMLNDLPDQKRQNITEIIKLLVPYLK